MIITSYFKNKKVTVDDVIKIGIDICSALELCASINITHNDIKPNNIFIGKDNNFGTITISILIALLVIFNHRKNIQRIKDGNENKLSFKKTEK